MVASTLGAIYHRDTSMTRRFIIGLVFTVGLTLGGCGDEPKPPPPAPAPAPAATIACPVEGTRFPADRGVEVRIDGKVRRVCSQGCAIRLTMDPEAFKDGK